MNELSALIGIGAALSIGAVSPGASFVMVARTAVSHSRAAGLYAALGMGIGGLVFAFAALLGLHGILSAAPSLYWLLKIAGGVYLAYLGCRIWLGASRPLVATLDSATVPAAPHRSFLVAFLTQISNPKAAIVYASVFAAFLPATSSATFRVAVVAMVFAIEMGWYAIVAVALSSQRPREAYLRFKTWIDRAAGGIMIALGLKLMTSAQR